MKTLLIDHAPSNQRASSAMVGRKIQSSSHAKVDTPVNQIISLCPCDGGCPSCNGIIQAKLKIGQPNDKYEQEADRVADQVMRMPGPDTSNVKGEMLNVKSNTNLQKQPEDSCPECEEDKGNIQAKPISDQITPLIQRDVAEDEEDIPEEEAPEEVGEEEESVQTKTVPGKTPTIAPSLRTKINSFKGGGQPLSKSVRDYFEPRFGEDFSRVRVHTNARAQENARRLGARAYTHGYDIVFGDNQYSPGTNAGRKILAHELTHMVQQRGNRNQINCWSVRNVCKMLCNSTDRWVVTSLGKLKKTKQGVYYYRSIKDKYKVFQKTPGGSKGHFIKYIYTSSRGETDKDKGIIRIILKLNDKEAASTLFHELTHVEQNLGFITDKEYDAWIQTAYFRKRHGMTPRFKGTWRKDILTPYLATNLVKAKVKKLYLFKDPRSKYIYEWIKTIYQPRRGRRIRPGSWRCPVKYRRSRYKWKNRPKVYLNPGRGQSFYMMRRLRDIVDVAQCNFYGMKTTRINKIYPLRAVPVKGARFKSTRYCTYGRYPRLKIHVGLPKGKLFYILQKIWCLDHDGKIKKMMELWSGLARFFAEESGVSNTKP